MTFVGLKGRIGVTESSEFKASRRSFMKRAAVAGAAIAAPTVPAAAQSTAPAQRSGPKPPPPDAAIRESMPVADVLPQETSGSDYIVDVLKQLNVDYICGNTADTLRGLQESIVNYGANKKPEFLTVLHEEVGVAMSHGYYKIAKKPLMACGHGTVGLMHASMAIYNAYCDRVPSIFIGGMKPHDAAERNGFVDGLQSANDGGAVVRDFVKWDDVPSSLQHAGESIMRAYRVSMTPPEGPVLIQLDTELQERPIPNRAELHIPKLTLPSLPIADAGAIAEVAKLLVNAKMPLIVTEHYARSQADVDMLVELSNLLQVPVVAAPWGRMDFPSHHPMSIRPTMTEVDLIVALNVADVYSITHAMLDKIGSPKVKLAGPNVKVVSIGTLYTPQRSNFQNFHRFADLDLAITGDPAASMPMLLEACKRLVTTDLARGFQIRGEKIAAQKKGAIQRAQQGALYGWDASPISTARMSAELYGAVKDEDWCLANFGVGVNSALWKFEKHHNHIGSMGGGGLGYGLPAAVGAALANREHGRFTCAIIGDGDMMYTPTALWTAAHHRIPLLAVVHNNRAYVQETMHLQRMANRHNRGIERAPIGCKITDPNIDFSKLAQSMGCFSEGPVENPADLGPALKRAVAAVKRGETALVDVVSQDR